MLLFPASTYQPCVTCGTLCDGYNLCTDCERGMKAAHQDAISKETPVYCNPRLVFHQSASGVVCACPNCGEPFPVWPEHTHRCIVCTPTREERDATIAQAEFLGVPIHHEPEPERRSGGWVARIRDTGGLPVFGAHQGHFAFSPKED